MLQIIYFRHNIDKGPWGVLRIELPATLKSDFKKILMDLSIHCPFNKSLKCSIFCWRCSLGFHFFLNIYWHNLLDKKITWDYHGCNSGSGLTSESSILQNQLSNKQAFILYKLFLLYLKVLAMTEWCLISHLYIGPIHQHGLQSVYQLLQILHY